MAPTRTRILLCFAIVYVVWGSTFLGIRIAIESFPPFLLGALRYGLAGLALLLVLVVRQERRPSWEDIREEAFNGVLLVTVCNGATVWMADKIPSGLSALLWATVPFWMVLLQLVSPGEQGRPGARSITGAVLGFLGLLVLVRPDGGDSGTHIVPAALAGTVGAFTWAYSSLRTGNRKSDASPMMRSALQMLIGGAVMLLPSLYRGELVPGALDRVTPQAWAAFLYLATFGSVIVGSAYLYLLMHVSASHVSTYAYVNPVVAVILGALIVDEKISSQSILGGLIIVAGVVLALSQKAPESKPVLATD